MIITKLVFILSQSWYNYYIIRDLIAWAKGIDLNLNREIDQERRRKNVRDRTNATTAVRVSSIVKKYNIFSFFLEKKEQAL